MKIIINGKQVWPTDQSPKQFAFRSEVNREDGTLVYTEHVLDAKGSPIGDSTIRIEMHPKQVQSICFSAQKFSSQKEERSTGKVRRVAGSGLKKIYKFQ